MPRSNRPRRRAGGAAGEPERDIERLLTGNRRTESRRGQEFSVQPISAAKATKAYVCPGCRGPVEVGVAHLVVWRIDGVLGDAADLAARRHWHEHCWRTA
jgi:hypothetical protein